MTGWLALRDDEHESYKVLLELREDGVIVLHRYRIDRRTGTEYGGFIRIPAVQTVVRQREPSEQDRAGESS